MGRSATERGYFDALYSCLLIAFAGSPPLLHAQEPISPVELQWLDGSNSLRVPGLESGSLCCGIAFIGDINGDGIDDLALDAGETHDGVGDVGTVYVLFGGVHWPETLALGDLDGDNGFAVWGDQELGYVESMSAAGDVNGDGFDDLLFGSGGSGEKAYVVFGAAEFPADLLLTELDGHNGFEIGSPGNGDFGGGVAGDFDLNRDGISDIAIGDRDAAGKFGEVYVIFGRETFPAFYVPSDLDGSNGFVIEGVDTYYRVGNRLTGLADFNGDGWNDLAAGDQHSRRTYVLFGSETFPARVRLENLQVGSGMEIHSSGTLISTVANAGDVNGDGLSDLLLGISGENASAGAAYVVYGSQTASGTFSLPTMEAGDGFVLLGEQRAGSVGFSGVGIGDYNQDGFDDVIVGAYWLNLGAGREDSGAAFVLFGGDSIPLERAPSDIDGVNGFQIFGAAKGDSVLSAQAGAGDLDGDGTPDIALTSVLADLQGTNSGLAYVVYEPTRPPIEIDQIGSCPGEVTRTVSYVGPYQAAGLYQSATLGETIVAEGPCAGTRLALANAELRRIDFADEFGTFTQTANLDVGFCSQYVQYLDRFTCETSAAMQVP